MNEVIKREVLEGEAASKAKNRIKKFYNKSTNKHRVQKSSTEEITIEKKDKEHNDFRQ